MSNTGDRFGGRSSKNAEMTCKRLRNTHGPRQKSLASSNRPCNAMPLSRIDGVWRNSLSPLIARSSVAPCQLSLIRRFGIVRQGFASAVTTVPRIFRVSSSLGHSVISFPSPVPAPALAVHDHIPPAHGPDLVSAPPHERILEPARVEDPLHAPHRVVGRQFVGEVGARPPPAATAPWSARTRRCRGPSARRRSRRTSPPSGSRRACARPFHFL
mgnify:CR=1 FL=1